MHQFTLAVTCAGLLAGSAAAQTVSTQSPGSLNGVQIRHAGTYSLATGKVTPVNAVRGPALSEPIYNNNAFTGSFFSLADGRTVIDEGRIPSPTSTAPAGLQTSYAINNITIGYATDAVDPSLGGTGGSIRLNFWDSWSMCTVPSMEPAPNFSIVLTGLPGSTTGALAALTVDIDTTGAGFCLQSDGDGAFVDGASDIFSWSIEVLDLGGGTALGPLTAGGPASGAAPGDGTAFQNPTAPAGSGLDTGDFFSQVMADGTESCTFFNGTPFASYLLTLSGDVTESCIVGTDLCAGVANSTGDGAILRSSGTDSLADNGLALVVSGLPMNSTGFFVVSQGNMLVMNPGGSQGNLCIADPVIGRYDAFVLDSGLAGQVGFGPDLNAVPFAGGAGTFGATPAAVGDTLNFQYWFRDTDAMGAATSNFSSATSIVVQ